MNTKSNPVEQLLRRQQRWNQYAWPLIIIAIGLAGTLVFEWHQHPSLARVEKWGHLPQWWIGGLAASLLAAAVVGWLRRRSVLEAAQAMDERWSAKNRLETAAALSSAPNALTRAQCEETAGFFRQANLHPRGIPLSFLAGLVALLVGAHLFTFASWTRPLAEKTGGGGLKKDSQMAQVKPAETKPKEPEAHIEWNSPEEEMTAAAVEEVPLEAMADSTTGFHNAVLEIFVNGETRPLIPIELADLKVAGKHTVETSIYMDQLGVKPYDIVSYDLRAQRNGIRKASDTVSAVQFVEIKPLREDVHECPPTQNPGQCFNYITAIKSAQLRAMKENFVLAHSELARDNADWKDENQRVGGDQKTLAEKTGEVISLLVSNGAPEEIVSLIRQAQPEMTDAAKKISATDNEPALTPQGKALALMTQVEKYLGKCVRQAPSLVQKVPDPFDKKALELKRRDQTPAGELEILAKEQARLADDIATTNPPAADNGQPNPQQITGAPAEREAEINQRISSLLATTNPVAEVTQHMEAGRNNARVALLDLNMDDTIAAREPAAESARELHLAVEAMKRAAEQVAKNELAEALRALSDAAGGARITAAQVSESAARQQATNVMNQVQNAARHLTDAARQQQETGSAKAAAQLNDLAKALAGANLQKALQQLREQPRDRDVAGNAANQLQDLADRAGLMRNDGKLSPEQIARLADRLDRAHANIQRLAAQNAAAKPPGNVATKASGSGSGSNPGGAASSFASEIVSDVREGALEAVPALPQAVLLGELRGEFHESPTPDAQFADQLVFLEQIDSPLEGVIKLLRAEISDQSRPYPLTDEQLAQAPAAYRPAVADYFEQLSRDYRTNLTAASK